MGFNDLVEHQIHDDRIQKPIEMSCDDNVESDGQPNQMMLTNIWHGFATLCWSMSNAQKKKTNANLFLVL